MVLLWVCCAAVATAMEQSVPSEQLSVYGDLEFVNKQKLDRYPAPSLWLLDQKLKIMKKHDLYLQKWILFVQKFKVFF